MWIKKRLLEQSQILPHWIGGFLVQLQMSIVYVGIANVAMIAITMWYTSGHLIAEQYLPFMTIRYFLLAGAFIWLLVIFVDYKYIAPARQKYMNRHTAKHKNPIVDLITKIDRDNETILSELCAIRERLNREEGKGNGQKQGQD